MSQQKIIDAIAELVKDAIAAERKACYDIALKEHDQSLKENDFAKASMAIRITRMIQERK